jgi:hypothetical protein
VKNVAPRTLAALGIDVVALLVFVVIGRISHGESVAPIGIGITAWPFLAGLVVGWVAARAWRHPFAIVGTGIVVWVATLVIGMLLRMASGQGVQFGFVIVATLFLGAFLVGWRAIVALGRRRNAQHRGVE